MCTYLNVIDFLCTYITHHIHTYTHTHNPPTPLPPPPTQALRNKAFGAALDFVWSAVGTGDYAVRESISRYVWQAGCCMPFFWGGGSYAF